MSATDVEPEVAPELSVVASNGSLRDRLAAKRRELQQDRTFVLKVQGYETEGLYARYRVLPYETLRRVGENNKRLEGSPEGELAIAADTLNQACVELLERREDGSYLSLECRWSDPKAWDLFGVELPEGATTRTAMYEIFTGPGGSTNLMLHFKDYDEQLSNAMPEIDEAIRGNSERPAQT